MTLTHRIFDNVIFYGLLITIVIAAIPYGSVQPWWTALVECATFLLAIFAALDLMITQDSLPAGASVALPLLILCLFLFFQSLPLFASPNLLFPNLRLSISADPYTTQLVALKLFAFVVFGLLLLRYSNTEMRLRVVLYVVIGVGIASAIFGLLRQSSGVPSWVLPLRHPERGFAQFVNRNHFGFLIEMTFGLALGLAVRGARGYRRWLLFLPVAAFLWISLIVANSRGAIFASLCQVLFMAILLNPLRRPVEAQSDNGVRLGSNIGRLVTQGLLVLVLVAAFAYGVRWLGGETVVSNFEMTSYSFTEQGGHERRENVSRHDIWNATWQLIKAHPILGSGFGGYWIAITKHHDASGTFTPQEAHSDYLELLAGGGIIGAALVIWFLVRFVKRARDVLRGPRSFVTAAAFGAVIGIFGAMIHNFVDFGIHITANALVFATLVVIASNGLKDDSALASSMTVQPSRVSGDAR